jgi:K+-sensing histidine kinase KdpD
MRESQRLAGLASALMTMLIATSIAGVTVVAKAAILMVTDQNTGFVIYVPAVALAAWYRGLAGGLVTTLTSALFDALIFLPPVLVLAADLQGEEIRLAAYLLGGVSVSVLSYRLRGARDRAQRESGERRRALEAEANARRQLDELIASERRANELRDAFNSVVSHELRTPITAIYGGAKLLARRDRTLDDTTRQELIDDLEAEADRLYRLVEDLLVLARSERGSIELSAEPIVIPRLVKRVVESEQSRWPAARFEVRIDPEVPAARGEDTYVEQVLRNLLSNAAKYSPAGAMTAVVVDDSPEGVQVRVLDNGAGIDPDEATRLFDLYYRSPATARTVGGAGIGLFVCRSLVTAMGGRIWASARPAGGTEFGFVLPRYDT